MLHLLVMKRFIPHFSLFPGAFTTVSSAHQTSSNASMRIAASSRLLTQSGESRMRAEELKSSLTDRSSGLKALQDEMAFSPNLTPVINKVKCTLPKL